MAGEKHLSDIATVSTETTKTVKVHTFMTSKRKSGV